MYRTARGWLVCTLAAGLLICIPAHAQETDTNVAIAAVSAGGIFGLGAHGSIGGSIAYPSSKHLMPFFDLSYSPLTSYGFTYGADNTGKGLYRSSVLDVNGGIRIRFPGKGDWVPYVGLGAGALRFSSSTYMSGFGTTDTSYRSHTDLAGNASVGGLYYITQHLGLSLELKGYAAQHNRFFRATAGVFCQFP